MEGGDGISSLLRCGRGLWRAKESIHPPCSPFCRDQPLAPGHRGLSFKSPMGWVRTLWV